MMLWEKATVLYHAEGGQVWQWQGAGQDEHPVLLMRHAMGMFGTELDVSARESANRRGSVLLQRRPQSLELEFKLYVQADTPNQLNQVLETLLNDLGDSRFGWLQVHTPNTGWRSIRVFKKAPVQLLRQIDPMVSCSTQLLVVLGTEDPYPVGPVKEVSGTSSGTSHIPLTLLNYGDVDSGVRLMWEGGATNLEVRFQGQRFEHQVTGNTLFDLRPGKLTATDARTTKLIRCKYDQNPTCVIPARSKMLVTVNPRGKAGTATGIVAPHFERLY